MIEDPTTIPLPGQAFGGAMMTSSSGPSPAVPASFLAGSHGGAGNPVYRGAGYNSGFNSYCV